MAETITIAGVVTAATTTRRVPYQSLREAMWGVDHEYRAGAPSAETAAIDGDICAHEVCGCCGQRGLDYRPYTRPGNRTRRQSYRAYAVCLACGHTEEL